MRIALALTVCLAPSIAFGDPDVQVDRAPSECVIEDALAQAGDLLGRDLLHGNAKDALQIVVTADAHQVVASVSLRDDDGTVHSERVISAESCTAIQPTLAVVIATLIRGMPVRRAFADADPMDPPDATILRAADPRRSIELLLGTSGTLSGHGVSNDVSFGARLPGARSLELEAHYELPESTPVARQAQVTTSRLWLAVVPCRRFGFATACATGAVGRIDASATGLDAIQPAGLWTVSVGGRIAAERSVPGGLALRVRLDLRVPLIQTRLFVDDMPVWTSSPVEVGLGIDMIARVR